MSVAIYGDFTPEITEKTKNDPTTGVYFNYMNFKCSTQYNILILWRNYGVHPAILLAIKAKKVYVDVHDICKIAHTCDDNMDKVTCFVVRSKFHMNGFKSVNKAFKHNTNIVAIPNGVRVSDFTPPDTVERDHNIGFVGVRVIHVDCYKYLHIFGQLLNIMNLEQHFMCIME